MNSSAESDMTATAGLYDLQHRAVCENCQINLKRALAILCQETEKTKTGFFEAY
jgi:hypothetical protein